MKNNMYSFVNRFLILLASVFCFADVWADPCANSKIGWGIKPSLKVLAHGNSLFSDINVKADDRMCFYLPTYSINHDAGQYFKRSIDHGGCNGQRIKDRGVTYELSCGDIDLGKYFNVKEETGNIKDARKFTWFLGNLKGTTFSAKDLMNAVGVDFKDGKATIKVGLNVSGYQINNKKNTRRNLDQVTSYVTITVHDCSAGKIKPDEAVTPNISEDKGVPVYGIYNSDEGGVYPIVNETDPSLFNFSDESVYFKVTNSEDRVVNDNIKSDRSFCTYPNYKDLLGSGLSFKSGEKRVVERVYYNSNFSCGSNVLTFQAVDVLHLDGFDENEVERFVCPAEQALPNVGDFSCTSENAFKIEGKSVDWSRVSNVFTEEVYGVVYGWEYKTSVDRNWRPVADFGAENVKDDVDLCISKSVFKENRTYYFRQVLYLKNFNKKVYASGENNYVMVKCFKKLGSADFAVSDFPAMCPGSELDSVLKVNFEPKQDGRYCGYKGESAESAFLYSYSSNFDAFNGSKVTANLSLPFVLVAESDINTKISVADGCGNVVDLSSMIKVHRNPELKREAIHVDGGSVSNSDEFENRLKVRVPEDKSFGVIIGNEDEEKSQSRYYISVKSDKVDGNGEFEWAARSLINPVSGYRVSNNIRTNAWYDEMTCDYMKIEKVNVSSGCVSEPVFLCVDYVKDLLNNNIYAGGGLEGDKVYVCKGELNKLLLGDHVSGGYGEGSYSYIWQYFNGSEWVGMTDADGKIIRTENLEAGAWIRPVDRDVKVRRYVRSNVPGGAETGYLESVSNEVTFAVYAVPAFDLLVDGQKGDLDICFGDEVECSVLLKNASDIESQGLKVGFEYCFENKDGSYTPFGKGVKKFSVDKDSVIYAFALCCNDTVYATEPVKIIAGENLKVPQEDLLSDRCKVRGETVNVGVNKQLGREYAFVLADGDTVEGALAEINLPLDGSVSFKVLAKKDGCVGVTDFKFNNEDMLRPLENGKLFVENSDGAKSDMICAGNPFTISDANLAQDGDFSYSWTINGGVPLADKNRSLVSDGSLFREKGNSYEVVRVTSDECRSVTDTIKFDTYDMIGNISLELSEDSVCFGGGATLSVLSVDGGSGYFRYEWLRETDVVADGEEKSYAFVNLDDEVNVVGVNVADRYCHNYNKYATKVIDVEPDLSFSLEALPSVVVREEFENNSYVDIRIEGENLNIKDKLEVSINSQSPMSYEYNGEFFTVKLDSLSFLYNVAALNVKRYGQNEKCESRSTVYVHLNDGFDGVPVVSSDVSQSISPAVVCGGSKVSLSISDYPSFGGNELGSEDFVHQWYESLDGVNWSNKGKAADLVVEAKEGVAVMYMCKLTYLPDGGKSMSVSSPVYEVQGKEALKLCSVSFDEDEERVKTLYKCKGETGTFRLSADSLIANNLSLQWYQMGLDNVWKPVEAVGLTMGSTLSECVVDLENYKENTYFRLGAVDPCNGTEVYSENLLQLMFNEGAGLSAEDVVLLSSSVYEGESLDSVMLAVPRDYKNVYSWTSDPSLKAWSVGNPIWVNGKFKQGRDSVFVYVTTKGKGDCSSDPIVYHFDVYKKISAKMLFDKSGDEVVCTNKNRVHLMLEDITGGDGVYSVDWYYKSDKMSSFAKVVDGDETQPFEVTERLENATDGGLAYLLLNYIRETCQFYAVVSSVGNYPDRSYVSNSVTKRVYPLLDPGRIDVATVDVCYGSYFSFIDGSDATGGSGNYSYEWLKSERTSDGWGKWSPVVEQTSVKYTGNSMQEIYRLYKTTRFCRVVHDDCISDTTAVKVVNVRDEFLIEPDFVTCNPLVVSGSSSHMNGLHEGFDYVWYDKMRRVKDTTEVYEEYVTESLKSAEELFFVKTMTKDDLKCLSSNYDTVVIKTFSVDGGSLTFEKFDASKDVFWICSGEGAGQVFVEGSEDLAYDWWYKVDDEISDNILWGKSGSQVRSATVNLDTCKLAKVLANDDVSRSVLEKKVSFFRRTSFTQDVNGEKREQSIYSDTVSVYIVPKLKLVEKLLLANSVSMAGSLQESQEIYCSGEKGAKISGVVDQDSELYSLWRNLEFGPYLYDRQTEEFQTWFEFAKGRTFNDTTAWEKGDVYYGRIDYAQIFSVGGADGMDTSYIVRRAFSDGCSVSYSNFVNQTVSDKKAKIEDVYISAISPEGRKFKDGIEFGDKMYVDYVSNEPYDVVWFRDEDCTDTLKKGFPLVFDSVCAETPSVVYMKRLDNVGCMSSPLAVSLPFFTKSDGGIISGNQAVCAGERFGKVCNYRLAQGRRFSPNSGEARVFSYQWQICMDEERNVWTDIAGAVNPEELPADKIEGVVNPDCRACFIRRAAVNETGRVCYSDTLTLYRYGEVLPGEISLESDNTLFCHKDVLPKVSSSLPAGGYAEFTGRNDYLCGWEIALNGGDFKKVSEPSKFGYSLDLEYVLRYGDLLEIDFDKNNEVAVRAVYSDACGLAYSEPLNMTIWKRLMQPSVYQNKKDCNSDSIVVKVDNLDEFSYYWFILDEDSNPVWTGLNDSLAIRRVSDIVATQYGVVGVDVNSGCVTDSLFFNVDSMPELSQGAMASANLAACYGSDVKIEGGLAEGGSGEKKYLWQMSYDLVVFEDCGVAKDLEISNVKTSAYFRRIVDDMCDSDTSETVFVRVYPKLNVDLALIEKTDFKCAGQRFSMKMNKEDLDSVKADCEAAFGDEFESVSVLISRADGTETDSLSEGRSFATFNGVDGDYSDFYVKTVVRAGLNVCESEQSVMRAYSARPIEAERNVVEATSLFPCNGSIVDVFGKYDLETEADDLHVEYQWFESKDGVEWSAVPNGNSPRVMVVAEGTKQMKRSMTNGCDTLFSNILKIEGQEAVPVDYVAELGLEITTVVKADSSSVYSVYTKADNASSDYVIKGKGLEKPLPFGLSAIPADALDSTVYIVKNAEICVSPYKVEPLRGGVISVDGNGFVCSGSDMPAIKASDVSGGNGEYSYQWYYKNENLATSDYVQIDGANGKTYTPEPISTKTWYRRETYAGEYKMVSNEVSVEIVGLPEVGYIYTDADTALLNSSGLIYGDFMTQKTSDMSVTLFDTVRYASNLFWQISEDGESWDNLVSKVDLNSEVHSLELNDTLPLRYYRISAKNSCGTSFSESFKVVTLNTPMIKEADVVVEHAVCKGKNASIICYDNAEHTYTGEFYYRCEGYPENTFYGKRPYEGNLFREEIEFHNVTEPFVVTMVRVSKTTGVETRKEVKVEVLDFKADFSFEVNGLEYPCEQEDVAIEQGALVQFKNKSKNATVLYWELIQPANPQYCDKFTRGLMSYVENPMCYFYNAERYEVSLVVTNPQGCRDTAVSSALYIPQEVFRSYDSDVVAEFVDEGDSPSFEFKNVEVYPTLFSQSLTINAYGKEFEYVVVDVNGRVQKTGRGHSRKVVDLSDLSQGSYTVLVNGRAFKIAKRHLD